MTGVSLPESEDELVERLKTELAKAEPSAKRRITEKLLLAALGSIPWLGGFISAAADFKAEEGAARQDKLQTEWLREHERRIRELLETLHDVQSRIAQLGPDVEERIQSEEYLTLVRGAFRAWDEAETEEKRRYAANLLVNAAGTRVCSDDVVRLFIKWIDEYHESHFAVIREIYKHPRASRFDIWTEIYGNIPREDSAEADLFKLLIRDLSTGGVIRQERATTIDGDFLRRRSAKRLGPPPTTLESAFEGTKPHVLTELGKQFVHYTMNEIVGRLETNGGTRPATSS